MSKFGGLPPAGPLLARAATGDSLGCPRSRVYYIGDDEDTDTSHDDGDVANSGASTDIYDDVGWESAGRKTGAALGGLGGDSKTTTMDDHAYTTTTTDGVRAGAGRKIGAALWRGVNEPEAAPTMTAKPLTGQQPPHLRHHQRQLPHDVIQEQFDLWAVAIKGAAVLTGIDTDAFHEAIMMLGMALPRAPATTRRQQG